MLATVLLVVGVVLVGLSPAQAQVTTLWFVWFTDGPDKVARLVEFLGGADAMTEYVSKAMFLPTRKHLVRQGG